MLFTLFRGVSRRGSGSVRGGGSRAGSHSACARERRLALEPLEDRRLLAVAVSWFEQFGSEFRMGDTD